MADGFQTIVALVLAKFLNDLGILGIMNGVICGAVLATRYPEFGKKVNKMVTIAINHCKDTFHQLDDTNNDPSEE